MASKNITPPEDSTPANKATSNSSSESVSTSIPPATPTPTPKRHKTLRTAIRQLMTRATTEAVGKFGNQQDPKNRRVVGSSTMEIQTGNKPGETPTKKHVHVSVVMSVSDNPACTGSCPPAPVVPTDPPQKSKMWWWAAIPIIAYGLYVTPAPRDMTGPIASTPVISIGPTSPAPGTIATDEPIAQTPTSAPAPVISAPAPSAPLTPPPAATPPGATGGISGGSPGATPIGAAPVGGSGIAVCSNDAGNFSTEPSYASPHSPNWVKASTVSWNVNDWHNAECQFKPLTFAEICWSHSTSATTLLIWDRRSFSTRATSSRSTSSMATTNLSAAPPTSSAARLVSVF